MRLQRQDTKVQVRCLDSYNAEINGEIDLNFTPHFNAQLRFDNAALMIRRLKSNGPYISFTSNIVNNINDLVLAHLLYI